MTNQVMLEGWISVLAALSAQSRTVHQIYIQQKKHSPLFAHVLGQAQRMHVPIQFVPPAEISKHARGKSHGGIIAVAGTRNYLPLAALGANESAPFIVMLDGVEDPYNFGQAIRSIYAAGAHGLVTRRRDWTAVAATVAKASAGASEWIPMATVSGPDEAIDHFRLRGHTIACTTSDKRALSIFAVDLTGPLFLMIGGELRGINRRVSARADLLLRIPYAGPFRHALDVTSASAIFAFEVLRQRRQQAELPR